jgi:hypothetical protein
MQEALRRTELVKLESTLSFATLHMKLDSALADSSLMQSVLTIQRQIWVAPMHHALQPKVQQLQSGSQHDHLIQQATQIKSS